MKGLDGRKIGVAAARKAEAIETLIQKNGGSAIAFPIQGKQQLNEDICKQDIKELIAKPFDMIILTTGIGVETLERTAQQLQEHANFIGKLEKTPLAIRGSKTMNWLKKHDLKPSLVSNDGTMKNLFDSLEREEQGHRKRVYLQAYNQDDVELKDKLENLGFDVYLSKPYRYEEPEQPILGSLRQTIISQEIDAVIFTSKTQVQNLFHKSIDSEEIIHAFNDSVLAVAVGKVTASELEENGITNVFQPKKPKMGAMIVELSRHLSAVY